jgi:hypothetical protein
MHPLSWASLPPPAGSRSKTHISLPRLATGRPFRSHLLQLGNTSATSAGRAFRPQLTCPRPSLAAPYLPSPGPTFRPQLASYPAKSRLNWLRLPGPQPGVPSASNMLAIHSSYPLRVYSRSLDACMYIKSHWGYFAPPPPPISWASLPPPACLHYAPYSFRVSPQPSYLALQNGIYLFNSRFW